MKMFCLEFSCKQNFFPNLFLQTFSQNFPAIFSKKLVFSSLSPGKGAGSKSIEANHKKTQTHIFFGAVTFGQPAHAKNGGKPVLVADKI